MVKIIRRCIGFIAFLLGLALVVSLGAAGTLAFFNSPPQFDSEAAYGKDGITVESVYDGSVAVRFEVRRGESARSVGRRLADVGLIRNNYFWNLLCRFDREPIKVGSFLIEVPSSQLAIHRLLVSGRQILTRVTIPEGSTIRRTALLLEEAGICRADDFIAAASDPAIVERYRIPGVSMEGYLFPETYLFPPNFPAARVVQTMADTFFTRIAEIDEQFLAMSPQELNQVVVLASIVEREYRLEEEAPVMAGVFSNRLTIGMALQSCATVEYVITEILGRPHPRVLLYRDL